MYLCDQTLTLTLLFHWNASSYHCIGGSNICSSSEARSRVDPGVSWPQGGEGLLRSETLEERLGFSPQKIVENSIDLVHVTHVWWARASAGWEKREFFHPLEIGAKKQKIVENVKWAVFFRLLGLILVMTVCLPVWHSHCTRVSSLFWYNAAVMKLQFT